MVMPGNITFFKRNSYYHVIGKFNSSMKLTLPEIAEEFLT